MDYKTLMQAVEAMNDEELFLAEKKVSEERRRRAVQALGYATVSPGSPIVLIDLSNLANAVREKLRVEMSMCSEAALASVLDQIKSYSQESGDEAVVMQLLQLSLTAALLHEARCETARRLDSVR